MFPPCEEEVAPPVLLALALSMRSNATRIPFARRTQPPPAGYTYAGQFIFHDLTRDDTGLEKVADLPPDQTKNCNQPALDLNSLYGEGPFSRHRHLYEEDNASLKTGSVRTSGGIPFDLPLDPKTGRAILADSRNGENVALRQIHALFLNLHNRAVLLERARSSGPNLFAAARRLVRRQFQWLVRFDYLRKICRPSVFREIVLERRRQVAWPRHAFSIPVEFSHAAARFGHTMVRLKYDLNRDNLDVALGRMMGAAHRPGPLDPSLAIEWRRFFTQRQPANPIDTTIVEPMFELPAEALRRFGPVIGEDNPAQLPVRTLRRGAALRLPTGEQVRNALCPDAPISGFLRNLPRYGPFVVLADLGLGGRTPLWYYILLEAEVNERGAHLGEVGSRLIAEVVEGALQADPGSVWWQLRRDPAWRPPPWRAPNGELIFIDSFLDLARAVGLDDAAF